jgi:hypothetical protein
MGSATYIDEARQVATFNFTQMEQYGCPNDLRARLNYAKVGVTQGA